MTEIRSDYRNPQELMQLDGQVTGSTTEVEAQLWVDSANEFFHFDCGKFPPSAIDRNGKKVIQKIVAVCDLSKHLPNNRSVRPAKSSCGSFVTAGLYFHRQELSPCHEPVAQAHRA